MPRNAQMKPGLSLWCLPFVVFPALHRCTCICILKLHPSAGHGSYLCGPPSEFPIILSNSLLKYALPVGKILFIALSAYKFRDLTPFSSSFFRRCVHVCPGDEREKGRGRENAHCHWSARLLASGYKYPGLGQVEGRNSELRSFLPGGW